MTRQNIGPGRRAKAAFGLSVVALLIAAGILYAGPLDPPAGPITSTGKTLTEVEPRIAINATNTPGDADSLFKITQRGSYYLTGNMSGVAGKHGIEIAASGVTLDLNGFDLIGVSGMGAFDAVSVTVSGLSNIAIVNGSIRNWGGDGIDMFTSSASNLIVEGVRASGNQGVGIGVGLSSRVTNCVATGNTGTGVRALDGSVVTMSAATSNSGTGILVGNRCSISACTATGNGSGGISADGSAILNCSANGNTGVGITATSDSSIVGCSTSDNSGTGISVSFGCTVTSCTARLNSGHGFTATSGASIMGCTATGNRLVGIRVGSECHVVNNGCSVNGNGGDGANILATGSDNRIEGNNCVGADRGIDVDAAGNIIVKNTCAGNSTNWDIVANNYYGPIIDRAGIATAAVTGAAAAGTLNTSDPNANFSY